MRKNTIFNVTIGSKFFFKEYKMKKFIIKQIIINIFC